MKNITIHLGGWPLLVTIVLCTLKLTGVLNIPWGWCFCLFWLPFVILFAILGVMVAITVPFLIVAFIIEILSNR